MSPWSYGSVRVRLGATHALNLAGVLATVAEIGRWALRIPPPCDTLSERAVCKGRRLIAVRRDTG
jgi:hypothetical protein